MAIRLHRGDLPDLSRYGREVAIDTETMGLDPHRDRLCVVQLSAGDGSADVVQIPQDATEAPNLVKLLGDPDVTKIFHYARFDVAALRNRFGVVTGPLYCTKIASRLVRTYTDRHGLKDLCGELLAACSEHVLGCHRAPPPRSASRRARPRWQEVDGGGGRLAHEPVLGSSPTGRARDSAGGVRAG